jgi:hypothetical protein
MSLKPFPMLGSRCCQSLPKDCSFGVRNVSKNALVIGQVGSTWRMIFMVSLNSRESLDVRPRLAQIRAVMNSELEKKTRRSLDSMLSCGPADEGAKGDQNNEPFLV